MSFFSNSKNKNNNFAQNQALKNKIISDILLSQSPSEHFAAGAAFDISRRFHEDFEQAIQSDNCVGELHKFFTISFFTFCEHPEVVGFTKAMINLDNIDTDPRMWNTDIFSFPRGEVAVLCFMPVRSADIEARIIGIVTGNKGDKYYYCMLNKDENAFSDVIQNQGMLGLSKVGEIRGRGFELMNSFLNYIKN